MSNVRPHHNAVYLRTDEEAEAANAMLMASEFASRVGSELHMWRWVIIALHNAAQGAMVLSLRHGNGLLALSDECYAAWMKAYEANEPLPREKLDTYLGLYKKVKHRQWGQVSGNRRFVPQGSEGKDIKLLNEFRNEFIHFTPKGWSLGVDGLPRICLAAERLISFLAIDSHNVHWHSQEAQQLMQESVRKFRETMHQLQKEYANSAA